MPNPPSSHRPVRRVGRTAAAAVLVLGLGIAGCGGDSDDDSSTETTAAPTDAGGETGSDTTAAGSTDTEPAETTTTEASEPTDATPLDIAALPATGEKDGYRLTVEEIGTTSVDDAASAGIEEGDQVIYLKVLIENVDGEAKRFGGSGLLLSYEADGDEQHADYVYGDTNAGVGPLPTELAPGDSMEGVYGYGVPEGATLVEVALLAGFEMEDEDSSILIPLT